jgi:hypothetical protein
MMWGDDYLPEQAADEARRAGAWIALGLILLPWGLIALLWWLA